MTATLFVVNGKETLDIIREIKHQSELTEIGIQSSLHRDVMMTGIKKLNKEDSGEGKKELEHTHTKDDMWLFDEYLLFHDETNIHNHHTTKQATEDEHDQLEINHVMVEGYDDNETAL